MKKKTIDNIIIAVIFIGMLSWTTFMFSISMNISNIAYKEQQAGKASMLSNMVSEIVFDTRLADIWDTQYVKKNTHETLSGYGEIGEIHTQYSKHPMLQRLAVKILKAIEKDATLKFAAITDLNGYVSWACTKDINDTYIRQYYIDKNIIENASISKNNIIIEKILIKDTHWGYILLGYDVVISYKYENVKSNAIMFIYIIFICFALFETFIRKAIYKWSR